MLQRITERERQRAAQKIFGYYRQRYLPHTVLLPSARFGLYATAKELLSVGDRVIISPITCRTVIQALLAAGVTPVFVDVEPATGNIDIRRLPDSLLNTARAIVTTNLYGNPDSAPELKRIAATHGLLLIEDCAHIIQTVIEGHPIGSVGDVSVFSFKKYFDEPGGVIAFRDESAARKVENRVAIEAEMPPEAEERLRFIQFRLGRTPFMAAQLSRISSRLRRTSGVRSDPQAAPLATVQPQRRTFPTAASLLRVTEFLSRLDRFIADRMEAARDLIAHCPLALKKSCRTEEVCYLVVPFFSERRDAIVDALERRGIPTYFLYTPPMNEVFGNRLQSGYRLNTEVIELWCRNILPINPRFAREYLDVIRTYAAPN